MNTHETLMAYFSVLLLSISHAGQIHFFRGVAKTEPLGQMPVMLQYSKLLRNNKYALTLQLEFSH